MKRLSILCLLVALSSGCVTHKSCVVTSSPDYTDVELRKDWHGLILGICGFTTHAYDDSTFRLPGQKVEYAGSEIQEIPAKSVTNSYTGTISIFRDQKRVVVDLFLYGHPDELNGTYHYP
jgi:hypothetical protein